MRSGGRYPAAAGGDGRSGRPSERGRRVRGGRPARAVHASNQESVRAYIRSANKKGQCITLSDIKDFLKKHPKAYKTISTDFGLPGMTLLYNKNV